MVDLTRKILSGVAVLAVVLISACGSLSDSRNEGFQAFQWHFNALRNEDKDFHKQIYIDNVKVHIVTDRKYFNWNVAAAYGSPVAGYANTDNEIWLFGKKVDGKVIINQAILGHELNHLLNFKDSEVADPDKLEELGI